MRTVGQGFVSSGRAFMNIIGALPLTLVRWKPSSSVWAAIIKYHGQKAYKQPKCIGYRGWEVQDQDTDRCSVC